MTRFKKRTIAPLAAGALAAAALITVADADVLPFSGTLTQATDEPGTTESTIPADQLDLDELIAQGTDFDTDSVFVDLGPVGDFYGIYEYGTEQGTDNVAAELELLVADDDDPDGDGPIVTERDAAERFLLNHKCNALLALAVRKQVSRPIRARIIRPDEAAIAATEPAEPAEGAGGGQARATATETDPLGITHVLPLESVVEVGRVTVSVLDLDLIRARPAAVLADLVAGESGLADVLAGAPTTGDAFGTPEFFEAVWTSCLAEAAEEGTLPVPQTLHGQEVWTLKRDHPPDVAVNAFTSDVDAVTWLEDGLEIRVEGTFLDVEDDISVDPQLDLPTRDWLEHFADSVEPAMEVASRIAGRGGDEMDLLEREAFGSLKGFEYGDEIAGTQAAVAYRLSQRELTLENVLAAAAAGGATPTGGTESVTTKIRRGSARAVFPPGANSTNTRRRLSEPPNGFFVEPVAFVQMVAWDPEFLNSDAFRTGWAKGIREASDRFFDLDELRGLGLLDIEDEAELADLDVVDAVFWESEGVARIDYLLPCYSVTVSALSGTTLGDVADAVTVAQKNGRDEVFGELTERLVPGLPAGAGGDPFSPLLEDLDRDYALAALKARAQREEEQDQAAGAERARQDAHRAAFCSSSNLAEHFTGLPVEDEDGNGVADRLPENAAGKAGTTEAAGSPD